MPPAPPPPPCIFVACHPLHIPRPGATLESMFTIEHEFDSTVVTLVDDGEAPLQEDVVIHAFAEAVTLTQFDPRTGESRTITLSPAQLRDLRAALDLPEGAYRFVSPDAAGRR